MMLVLRSFSCGFCQSSWLTFSRFTLCADSLAFEITTRNCLRELTLHCLIMMNIASCLFVNTSLTLDTVSWRSSLPSPCSAHQPPFSPLSCHLPPFSASPPLPSVVHSCPPTSPPTTALFIAAKPLSLSSKRLFGLQST